MSNDCTEKLGIQHFVNYTGSGAAMSHVIRDRGWNAHDERRFSVSLFFLGDIRLDAFVVALDDGFAIETKTFATDARGNEF